MEENAILDYIKHLQQQPLMAPDHTFILDERDMELPLTCREEAMKTTLSVFGKRKEAYEERKGKDRTLFPIVVYSGMPGLGKTRMLEEWKNIFEQIGITSNMYGVVITYGNGEAPKPFEENMKIEASFGWRLLHRLFIEGNYNDRSYRSWYSKRFLPSNANDLTLDVALGVVRLYAEQALPLRNDEKLSLFVGVDEYQKIPDGPWYSEDQNREHTLLWQLLNAMVKRYDHDIGVHLYCALAGTKFGPLDITGCTVAQISRASMPFLDPQMLEEVIRSSSKSEFLNSPDNRRKLLYLGGIPRPSVKFVLGNED